MTEGKTELKQVLLAMAESLYKIEAEQKSTTFDLKEEIKNLTGQIGSINEKLDKLMEMSDKKEITDEELFAMRDKGMSWGQMSKQTGLGKGAIQYRIKVKPFRDMGI